MILFLPSTFTETELQHLIENGYGYCQISHNQYDYEIVDENDDLDAAKEMLLDWDGQGRLN